MRVFSHSWNVRKKWSYFALLVLCIDKVKGERSNVCACLLDGGILQPTEAGGGEGKGLAALGSPVHRRASQVLAAVIYRLVRANNAYLPNFTDLSPAKPAS